MVSFSSHIRWKSGRTEIHRTMTHLSALGLMIGSVLFVVAPVTGDTEVSCVFMESCILPCSFQGGTDAVVHWTQVTGDHPVYSYYHNKDQLALQDQSFRGRTSVFKDQISRGNVSLLLTGVKVQDQGRYRCYTSTIRGGDKDSFVNLTVDDQNYNYTVSPGSSESLIRIRSQRVLGYILATVIAGVLALVGAGVRLILYCIKKYKGKRSLNQTASHQNENGDGGILSDATLTESADKPGHMVQS